MGSNLFAATAAVALKSAPVVGHVHSTIAVVSLKNATKATKATKATNSTTEVSRPNGVSSLMRTHQSQEQTLQTKSI